MFSSVGKLITNPKSESTALGQWWMIVEACPELGRYYNRTLKFAMRARLDFALQVPSWGYHISVMRGEAISSPEAIAQYAALNGEEVEFQYDHEIKTNGRYYWLPVECERLLDIREVLGLPRHPYYNFHLTIGVNPLMREPDNERGQD